MSARGTVLRTSAPEWRPRFVESQVSPDLGPETLALVLGGRLWRASRDARMCLASVVDAGLIELPRRPDAQRSS
jgi:hypothetical protein